MSKRTLEESSIDEHSSQPLKKQRVWNDNVLEQLPLEIWPQIMRFLKYKFIVRNVNIVNKFFNQLISGNDHHTHQLWSMICEHQRVTLQMTTDEIHLELLESVLPRLKITKYNLTELDEEEHDVKEEDNFAHEKQMKKKVIDHLKIIAPFVEDIKVSCKIPDFPTKTSDEKDDEDEEIGDEVDEEDGQLNKQMYQLQFPHLKAVTAPSQQHAYRSTEATTFIRDNWDRFHSTSILDLRFTNLKSFKTSHYLSGPQLVKVLTKNQKTLKQVVIDTFRDISDNEVIQAISLCPIEKLKCHCQNLSGVLTFNYLKELNLSGSDKTICALLSGDFPQLTELTLFETSHGTLFGSAPPVEKEKIEPVSIPPLNSLQCFTYSNSNGKYGDLMQYVFKAINPKLKQLTILGNYGEDSHFTHLKHLECVVIHSTKNEEILKQNCNIHTLDLSYSVWNSSYAQYLSNNPISVLRVRSISKENDLEIILHNVPTLRSLEFRSSMSVALLSKILLKKQDSLKEIIFAGASLFAINSEELVLEPFPQLDLLQMSFSLPSLEEWILLFMSLHHHVDQVKFKMSLFESNLMGVRQCMDIYSTPASFMSKRLRRALRTAIPSKKISISEEEQQNLYQVYDRLFSNHITFEKNVVNFPAVASLMNVVKKEIKHNFVNLVYRATSYDRYQE
jgi:hypothetical protein